MSAASTKRPIASHDAPAPDDRRQAAHAGLAHLLRATADHVDEVRGALDWIGGLSKICHDRAACVGEASYELTTLAAAIGYLAGAQGVISEYALNGIMDAVESIEGSAEPVSPAPADSALLAELQAAHQIILNALAVMNARQKDRWARANADSGIQGEGTTRFHERQAVLDLAAQGVRR